MRQRGPGDPRGGPGACNEQGDDRWILTAACANSFSTNYKGTGPASEALAWSKQAQARHGTLASGASAEDSEAIAKLRVYIDSIPGELTLDGTTIGVKEGIGAALLGQVRFIATMKVPSEEEAIPVIQPVAYAGGANLAFCPVEGMGHRCYLVRATAE